MGKKQEKPIKKKNKIQFLSWTLLKVLFDGTFRTIAIFWDRRQFSDFQVLALHFQRWWSQFLSWTCSWILSTPASGGDSAPRKAERLMDLKHYYCSSRYLFPAGRSEVTTIMVLLMAGAVLSFAFFCLDGVKVNPWPLQIHPLLASWYFTFLL